MGVLSDDIGSFPIPGDKSRDGLQESAFRIVSGEASPEERQSFNTVVSEIMELKLRSGIHRPNYPQVQDMVSEFFHMMERFHSGDSPWVVRDEYAVIPELEAVDEAARKYYAENNSAVELRVCVTGPLELYLKKVGFNVEADLLGNIAESVSKFVGNAVIDRKYLRTAVVCLDEPSLGVNPSIVVDRDVLVEALDRAVCRAKGLDVQVHLHSPSEADLVLETENINVLGVESAEDPDVLHKVSRSDLEAHDKFLRAGISRTNISGIAADFLHRSGVDVWKEKCLERMLDEMESLSVIVGRLENAYRLFGDRLRYAGPDCGLGSWPSQELAFQLLRNTAEAVDGFNSR